MNTSDGASGVLRESSSDRTRGLRRSDKMERICRFCQKNRRGTAAVEFAVVLPVFLLLVLGMIEYGRMVMVQQILTNASREGARRAVIDGVSTSDVQTAVATYLTNASINGASPAQVTTAPPVPPDYAESITVTVSVPFSQVSWLPSPMFLSSFFGLNPQNATLSATTTMRRETVQ